MDKSQQKSSDRSYIAFGIRTIGELGGIIAVPVVVFALAGKWLDTRYHTAPFLLIAGFILAALVSGFAVYRRANELGKEYQDLDKKKDSV